MVILHRQDNIRGLQVFSVNTLHLEALTSNLIHGPRCSNLSDPVVKYQPFIVKIVRCILVSSAYKPMLFPITPATKTFPSRSQLSKVIYKANCWDCKDFYIGKTKRRLHDRKTEHFKALSKHDHSSAIADHVKTTGHNINWDHFDILASGKTDYHCKVKETLFIQELQPALNANVSSEKLLLY